MSQTLTHARNLIRCRSVTPQEGGALRYLANELTAAGFACHMLDFGEPGTASVSNLYARLGAGPPHICFAGHTDVVPPGDEKAWAFLPFAAEVREGVLYGRGAVDMKGGLAACLTAVLDYIEGRHGEFEGSISFLVTGDEEGPAINGTRKLVDWLQSRGERPDYCILAECTSEAEIGDTIKIGRRGSLSAKLTVAGVQGHVAYPHKAKNPLPGLIDALNLLRLKPLDEGSDHFQPSHFEITSIDTGNATANLIPASASARFNIRFNDHHTGESLKAWIESQVRAALLDTGLTYDLAFEPVADCFVTQPAGFVAKLRAAIEAETGREPMLSTGGGTSDARFIKDICPVVEIGLLNGTAHKVNECVAIADLERLTRIFTRFLYLTFA